LNDEPVEVSNQFLESISQWGLVSHLGRSRAIPDEKGRDEMLSFNIS
jgi:hypothetical protein